MDTSARAAERGFALSPIVMGNPGSAVVLAAEDHSDRAEEQQHAQGEQVVARVVRGVFVEFKRAHHAQPRWTSW